MTKQVALADATYRRLRASRLPGESFSAAIERLLDARPKDPMGFLAAAKAGRDPDEWVREVQAERESTRTEA